MKKTNTYWRGITLAVSGLAIIVIIALLFHIHTLSSRIASMEVDATRASHEIASFQRDRCSHRISSAKANTVATYSIESGGRTRTYRVHTPNNYDPTVRYPVIVNFDGIEGNGARMEGYSGIDALPAFAVYPDSLPGKQGFTAWQGAPYSLEGEYDIQFVRALLDALPSHYCIDSTKQFAVGMSNGGGFAVLAGCEIADKFKAVASVSGAYYESCRNKGSQSVSLLAIHSTADRQVPFSGSSQRGLPAVVQWAKTQATVRGCGGQSIDSAQAMAKTYSWFSCKDGSMVRLVVLESQSHGWLTMPYNLGQSMPRVPNSTAYIWKFFTEV